MQTALLTLVLLLCTSLTSSLGIDGVRNSNVPASLAVTSVCGDSDGLCSDLVCSNTDITVTLKIDALKAKNIDFTSLYLRDRRCSGFPYNDTEVTVKWSLGQSICGTELIVTSTEGIYKNQIFLPFASSGIIYREIYVINVTCSYPLDYNVTQGPIRPDPWIEYINITNVGQFKVKMDFYKDISYTAVYTDPVIELSTRSYLYVGVYIVDPTYDYSLLMVNCFATPTDNLYDPLRYNMIINSWPNPEDTTIRILENGISPRGRFYVQVFKFIGDYTYVYFHCQVHLCPQTCPPTHRSGSKAADTPTVHGSLTIGPIRILAPVDPLPDSVGKPTGYGIITMMGLMLINKIFL